MRLTWQKKGCPRVICEGMRNTKTGVLRPLTEAEVAEFRRKFEGSEFLVEPITILLSET